MRVRLLVVVVETGCCGVDSMAVGVAGVPVLGTTAASQQVAYKSAGPLKAQYHWKVYVPGATFSATVKVPVQSDLSVSSQNRGQFMNPLKSI